MPNDAVTLHVLNALSFPLLSGSLPQDKEDVIDILHEISSTHDLEDSQDSNNEDYGTDSEEFEETMPHDISYVDNYMDNLFDHNWLKNVDFVVENGPRHEVSTVIDLTSGYPIVLRQGKGSFDLISHSPHSFN